MHGSCDSSILAMKHWVGQSGYNAKSSLRQIMNGSNLLHTLLISITISILQCWSCSHKMWKRHCKCGNRSGLTLVDIFRKKVLHIGYWSILPGIDRAHTKGIIVCRKFILLLNSPTKSAQFTSAQWLAVHAGFILHYEAYSYLPIETWSYIP